MSVQSVEAELEKEDIKSTAKDSIFRDLFRIRRYSLLLYLALHPEDTDVTEDDIDYVTIENIITDQQYNDLGMMIRGKLIVLLEAQSTWTMNIIIRILLYLAHTWNRYIEETKQNRYGSKKLDLPKPEFYVIYTGSPKREEKWIHLSKEFFNGSAEFLEVNVRVMYGDECKGNIINQYADFTKVYDAQVKQHGRTRKAILETIRICKDKNILKDYLEDREKEVISIMTALFNQKRAVEQYGYEKMEEGREEGREEERKKNIRSMAKFMPVEQIARILEIPVEKVTYLLTN